MICDPQETDTYLVRGNWPPRVVLVGALLVGVLSFALALWQMYAGWYCSLFGAVP